MGNLSTSPSIPHSVIVRNFDQNPLPDIVFTARFEFSVQYNLRLVIAIKCIVYYNSQIQLRAQLCFLMDLAMNVAAVLLEELKSLI